MTTETGSVIRALGNILWFIFAGVWLALGYAIAGLALCITIIGIPFGIQAFKLSVLALWPFGRSVCPVNALSPNAVVTHSVLTNPVQG